MSQACPHPFAGSEPPPQSNLTPFSSDHCSDYERLLPEIERVRSDELVPIEVDIPQAVATALGAWPEIRVFRAAIMAETPHFDIARFDDYEAYARALGHAHARYANAIAPSGKLPPLAERALLVRDQLLTDASALARRGLIGGTRLRAMRGPVGYRSVAFDLLVLATLIRESWDKIAGKSAITLEELDGTESLATRLLNEVDLRRQVPAAVAEAEAIRHRAFTLFIYTHDQVRRALSYVRWNDGDVDEIAPPLCARSRRAKCLTPSSARASSAALPAQAEYGAPAHGSRHPGGPPDSADTLVSIPVPETLRTVSLSLGER